MPLIPRKTAFLVLAGFGLFLGSLLFYLTVIQPVLPGKMSRDQNQQVALAIDWADVEIFSHRENKSLRQILDAIISNPITFVAMPSDTSAGDEQLVRGHSSHVLWYLREGAAEGPSTVFARFQPGDGLFPGKETVFGYPGWVTEVVTTLTVKDGFLAHVEFLPQKGFSFLAPRLPGHIVKTHVLPMEEMIASPLSLWLPRLVRAVRERGVQLLMIRFSPNLSFQENIQFQARVAQKIGSPPREGRGQGWGLTGVSAWKFQKPLSTPLAPPLSPPLTGRGTYYWTAGCLLFLIGLLTPLFCALWVRTFDVKSPILMFLGVSGLTMAAGVVIHGLGVAGGALESMSPVRGVKLLLILPWVGAGLLLLSKAEMKNFKELSVKVKHLIWGGGISILFLGLILMRSGNFPFLPVTFQERYIRDVLENLLGVRPRFKEVFIGHPLFILGLYLRAHGSERNLFRDGRFWLWVGLIGQISILNTFMHIHTPLLLSVLRTFHGLWIGAFLSIPFCYIYRRFTSKFVPEKT